MINVLLLTPLTLSLNEEIALKNSALYPSFRPACHMCRSLFPAWLINQTNFSVLGKMEHKLILEMQVGWATDGVLSVQVEWMTISLMLRKLLD